jgi:hypothetical protein
MIQWSYRTISSGLCPPETLRFKENAARVAIAPIDKTSQKTFEARGIYPNLRSNKVRLLRKFHHDKCGVYTSLPERSAVTPTPVNSPGPLTPTILSFQVYACTGSTATESLTMTWFTTSSANCCTLAKSPLTSTLMTSLSSCVGGSSASN